jgi:nucleotide-binding universal stress UspA family protein
MSRKPVVVGVDGSPESVRAAALGWRIAQAAGVECRLIHALPDVWAASSLAQVPTYSAQLERDLMDDARRHLDVALGDAVPRDIRDRIEVRIGRAALVLSAVIGESGGAELVVLGGKHHGPLARGFGGSTAHYLVRTLDVPLLVVGPTTQTIERVLAAVDLSNVAGATLGAARRIARLLGARLRLMHVVEPIKFPTVVPLTLDQDEFYRRSVAAFERLAAPVAGVAETDRVTRRGEAAVAVEAEAAGWPADLIVVGSHGKGLVDRVLVGSTTERLLNALPASLLVVPAAPARVGIAAARRPRPAVRKRTRRVKGKARHESR